MLHAWLKPMRRLCAMGHTGWAQCPGYGQVKPGWAAPSGASGGLSGWAATYERSWNLGLSGCTDVEGICIVSLLTGQTHHACTPQLP